MRKYDVIVLGASGVTGRLVCEHIAKVYQATGLRWAMAGRDDAKLAAARKAMAAFNAACADVDLLRVDLDDEPAMAALVAQAKVLITTVGPYARFGRPVVKACVEQGTHYVDITAESHFVRNTIDEFHAAARAARVRVVHNCGYDSVPSDAVALLAACHMRGVHGKALGDVTVFPGGEGGGVGGTTVDSFLNVFADPDPMARRIRDPYLLDPKHAGKPPAEQPARAGGLWPAWATPVRAWTGPWPLDAVNSKIVRRSNALLGYVMGERVRYAERFGEGLLAAALLAAVVAVGSAVAALAARLPWLRAALLPATGTAPPRSVLDASRFSCTCFALSEEEDGGTPVRVKAQLEDPHRDPGYLATSRMLLECALCIVYQEQDLADDPYASQNPAGVLTPSSAFGLVLHARLRAAGFLLSVEDCPFPAAPSGHAKAS